MSEARKNYNRIEKYLRYSSGEFKKMILDIGSGDDPICPNAFTLDNKFPADYKCDASKIICITGGSSEIVEDNTFEVVHSSHCLEDILDWKAALREWIRVLMGSGILLLYLPHRDYYPNIGEEFANKAHKHDFVPEDILPFLIEEEMEIVSCEVHSPPDGKYDYKNRGNIEYSFSIVARKGEIE